MKKILAAILAMMMIFTLFTGCAKDDSAKEPGDDPQVSAPVDDNEDSEAQEPEDDDSNSEDAASKPDDKEDNAADSSDSNKNDGQSTQNTTPNSTQNTSGNSSDSSGKPAAQSPSKDEEKKQAPKGTPSKIIDKIYEKKPVELPLGTMDVDLSDGDALKAVTGISTSKYVKAAAYSESMMGAQAYSLVVVRATDSKYADDLAEEMINGIDPRKWVCVEADDLRVAAYDDLIVLIMVDSQLSDVVTSKQIVDAFKDICGGSLDINLK